MKQLIYGLKATNCKPLCFLVIPQQQHPKLSVSLRERLKRTRRSFTSPLSVAKRLCVDEEEEEGGQQGSDKVPGPVLGPTHVTPEVFAQQLRKEIKSKTETLRRLRMVKMYRSKVTSTHLYFNYFPD